MAITTRSELITAVSNWLRRPSIVSFIPDFISLCEADLQRRLKVGEQELVATLTTTAGNASVTLPVGFSKMRRLRLMQSYGDTDLWPVALAPSDDQNWNYEGRPRAVSMVGNTLNIRPVPDSAYTLEMNYYAKFTPLTALNPTNWILTDNPDVYLYGTLMQSAPYLGSDNRLPLWEGGYNSAVAGINREDFEKRNSLLQRQTEVAHLTGRGPYNIFGGY